MKSLLPFSGLGLLLCLWGCGQPVARLGSREVWLGESKTKTRLGPDRSLWQLPVLIKNPAGEQISLEVQLECDGARPASGLISLINLRREDPLLGINRRDPSLERSWSGADGSLPPTWLKQLAISHCTAAQLPPRWRSN